MNNHFRPKVDSTRFVVQELPGELLLYNLATNKAYALNQTSALVWQNCTGRDTVSEMADNLTRESRAAITEELIWLTLERLNNDGLINIDERSIVKEIKLKRRELLKKVCLTTVAALPVVHSLMAPKAASAQSGIILQQCSVCLTKTHEYATCTDICQDIVVGDCHDNAGCGMGIFLSAVTCGECLGSLPPSGPSSTVSWHGTQYKV